MKHRNLLSTVLALCLLLTCFVSCGSSEGNAFQATEHEHSYSEATCTQPRTCSCGMTQGMALGHNYRSATCTTPKICGRCGSIATAALGHDYSEATCASPQICRRCDVTLGNPIGHDYIDATCFEPEICSNCNDTKGSPLGHTYRNNKCIRCKHVDPESLPANLGDLPIIDLSTTFGVGWRDEIYVDSFGDSYTGYFRYNNLNLYDESGITSIHNLNGKYSTFTGGIVCSPETDGASDMVVKIYVDGVLKYTSPTFDKTTGKIDFSIDVSGGQKLTIEATAVATEGAHLVLVETMLTKE